MDRFFINKGEEWLGPMSEIEFEFHKGGLDEFVYWKPEFCPNRVVHPHLCSHSKKWVKPPLEKPNPPESGSTIHKQVILEAKPYEDEPEKEQLAAENTNKKTDLSVNEGTHQDTGRENGFTHKLLVIIIGFLVVLVAAYYANSRLSIMFYQDIIIQESVKDIEYFTRDVVEETKAIRNDLDSLNAVMGREFKAIRHEINEVKQNLQTKQ